MTDLFDLSGKVAIITGSTRGIGRGIAEAFVAAGATVVISSENAEDVAVTECSFVERGFRCHGIFCDVIDHTALRALVDGTIAEFGAIDILVCNAGITDKRGDSSVEDFDRVMAVNLRSQVALTNLALPHIAARKGSVLCAGKGWRRATGPQSGGTMGA
jgi:NAD(P)-dependent dehydrogenase (short-subunit alcohol dehydrogenase family)